MLLNEKLKLNTYKKCSIFKLASPKNGHSCGVKGMDSILGKFLNVQFLNLHSSIQKTYIFVNQGAWIEHSKKISLF
jgi:hypothetical protein